MTGVHAYLTFNGNCREAMHFYRDCFGGTLTIQAIGDTPFAGELPQQIRDRVLHAMLHSGDLLLMGSDMVPDRGLLKGNSVALSIRCGSVTELERVYRQLAAGGQAEHPPEDTFWGSRSGDLTDKYGNHWLLYTGEYNQN